MATKMVAAWSPDYHVVPLTTCLNLHGLTSFYIFGIKMANFCQQVLHFLGSYVVKLLLFLF